MCSCLKFYVFGFLLLSVQGQGQGLSLCAAFSSLWSRAALQLRRAAHCVASPLEDHGLRGAGSAVATLSPSCPVVCGVFQDQGADLCPSKVKQGRWILNH